MNPKSRHGEVDTVAVCHPSSSPSLTAEQFKFMEERCRALSEENVQLRQVVAQQTLEVQSAATLVAERKVHMIEHRTMEDRIVKYDTFLQELLGLLTGGCSLSSRGDPNAHEGALATPKDMPNKCTIGVPKKGGKHPTMDEVRVAAQKQLIHLQAMEKELGKRKQALVALKEKDQAKPTDGLDWIQDSPLALDCFVPCASRELDTLRKQLRTVEQKLHVSEMETRRLSVDRKKMNQELHLCREELTQSKAQMEQLRALVDSNERLAHEAEERCHAVEKELTSLRTTPDLMTAPARGKKALTEGASSAGSAGAPPNESDDVSNSRGGTLVTSRHYCLFSGSQYVAALQKKADSFKDALLRCVACAVHVPYGFMSNVDIKELDGAVRVEMDIRHVARLSETEVDLLLLSCPFAAVNALQEDLLLGKPADVVNTRLHGEIIYARSALKLKQQEAQDLSLQVQRLEKSLARRDDEREDTDQHVTAVLDETEVTIKELCAEVAAQRLALQKAQEQERSSDSTARSAQCRINELEASLKKAEASAESWKKMSGKISASITSSAARMASLERENVRHKEALQSAIEAHTQSAEKYESQIQEMKRVIEQLQEKIRALSKACAAANREGVRRAFECSVKLHNAELTSVAAALLSRPLESEEGGTVLQQLVLHEAAHMTGTVPLQMLSCSSNPSQSTLDVRLELLLYKSYSDVEAAVRGVHESLAMCGFTQATHYLRQVSTAQRRQKDVEKQLLALTNEMKQERADLTKRTEQSTRSQKCMEERCSALSLTIASQKKELSVLQGEHAQLHSKLDAVLAQVEGKKAATLVSKLEVLTERLSGSEHALCKTNEHVRLYEEKLQRMGKECHSLQAKVDLLTRKCEQAAEESRIFCTQISNLEAALIKCRAKDEAPCNSVKETVALTEGTPCKKDLGEAAVKSKGHSRLAQRKGRDATEAHAKTMQEQVAAKDREILGLLGQLAALRQAALETGNSTDGQGKHLSKTTNAESAECELLRQQVKEMEVDMSDMTGILTSVRASLEAAQREIRCKKQDINQLGEQLAKAEEEIGKLKSERATPKADTRPNVAGKDAPSSQTPRMSGSDPDSSQALAITTKICTLIKQSLSDVREKPMGLDEDCIFNGSRGDGASPPSIPTTSTACKNRDAGLSCSVDDEQPTTLVQQLGKALYLVRQLSAHASEMVNAKEPLLRAYGRHTSSTGAASLGDATSPADGEPLSLKFGARSNRFASPFARVHSSTATLQPNPRNVRHCLSGNGFTRTASSPCGYFAAPESTSNGAAFPFPSASSRHLLPPSSEVTSTLGKMPSADTDTRLGASSSFHRLRSNTTAADAWGREKTTAAPVTENATGAHSPSKARVATSSVVMRRKAEGLVEGGKPRGTGKANSGMQRFTSSNK